jgi:hypothetical protein
MAEESTPPDLAEIVRRVVDFDAVQMAYGPNAVLDILALGAQAGHPGGSTGRVKQSYAAVATLTAGLIERQSNYLDRAEARGAAERLAEERG